MSEDWLQSIQPLQSVNVKKDPCIFVTAFIKRDSANARAIKNCFFPPRIDSKATVRVFTDAIESGLSASQLTQISRATPQDTNCINMYSEPIYHSADDASHLNLLNLERLKLSAN